jgi:D-alanyl-D-alanine carboxypeptidase
MRRIRVIQFAAAVVAVSCLVSASSAAARTAHFSVSTRRALTSIAVSGMGAGAMPGLEVGVWVPGEGSFVRAFGTSDLATGAPLQLGDHFRIASISKSFTATAILRLVDQHRLSLDAHLSDFIRGIRHGNQITVAQLLDMTSGVYDYVNDPAILRAYARNPRRPFSLRDVVSIIKRHRPMFAPGAKAVYDNSNYYLLGAIAQKVTHEPLGRVIQSKILRPLRLRHTSYPTSAAMPAPFSHGYLDQPDFPPRDVTASNPAFAGGAGAMISTLGDLKVWAKALATGSLLTRPTHREQLKTRVLSKSRTVTLSYGMGITDVNGFLGHDGAIFGYGSTMLYLPSRHATIIVLGNNNDLGAPKPLIMAVAIAAYLFPDRFPHGL